LAWAYYILLILISMGALALVVLTLPGLWLMTAAAAVYALLTHEHYVGRDSLIALFLLSLIGEILEFFAGGAMAKRAGGSRSGAWGAIVGGIIGGIIGSFVLPIVLTIVGICIGSFVGAAAFELLGGGQADLAVRVGWGAAKGRFVGMMMKLAIGAVMAGIILVTAFP
jgi:uncharacterized protein YqgC (DUF456 family)